jgi:hypothetical protein
MFASYWLLYNCEWLCGSSRDCVLFQAVSLTPRKVPAMRQGLRRGDVSAHNSLSLFTVLQTQVPSFCFWNTQAPSCIILTIALLFTGVQVPELCVVTCLLSFGDSLTAHLLTELGPSQLYIHIFLLSRSSRLRSYLWFSNTSTRFCLTDLVCEWGEGCSLYTPNIALNFSCFSEGNVVKHSKPSFTSLSQSCFCMHVYLRA